MREVLESTNNENPEPSGWVNKKREACASQFHAWSLDLSLLFQHQPNWFMVLSLPPAFSAPSPEKYPL